MWPMESRETRVGKRRRDRRGMKIKNKKKGEQADQKKKNRWREGEREGGGNNTRAAG